MEKILGPPGSGHPPFGTLFIVSTYLLAVEVGEISFLICPWGLGEVSKITELLVWIPPLFPRGLGVGVTID